MISGGIGPRRPCRLLVALLAPPLLAGAATVAAAEAAAQAGSAPAPAAVVDGQGVAQTPAFLGGLLSQSRILYPLQVQSWAAVSEERYAQQETGVSVRYVDSRRRRWIDLFFQPAAGPGKQSMVMLVAMEKEGIARAASEGGQELEMGMVVPISLASADGAVVPAWELGMRFPAENRNATVLLFARDLYVVKARANAVPGELRKTAQDVETLQLALREFMQDIAARVRIANTGGCWLPALPAAALPAADADGVLASRRAADGSVVAVALRDRVLVDPAQAARATGLGAELSAQLYPGCVAPEAIELEVPESMRELRIEYRAPGDEPSLRGPPVGRPRPPLSGTG